MLLVLLITLLHAVLLPAVASQQTQIAKHGCQDECGGVKIPYPFGIGDGCFYDDIDSHGKHSSYGLYYKITCDSSTTPPSPIYGTDIPVLNISLSDQSFRIDSLVAYDCYKNNKSTSTYLSSLSMVEFTVSTTKNKFVAIGCDTKASISGYRFNQYYYYFTGCMTYCQSVDAIQNMTCSGVGCCETPVPDGTSNITSKVFSYFNHSYSPFNPCSAAFVVEEGAFNFSIANITSPEAHFHGLRLPVVFDWSILGSNKCGAASSLCGLNTDCANASNGYTCKCKQGYSGNPYLPQGCQGC